MSTAEAATFAPFSGAADAATQVVEARADPRVAVDLPVELHCASFMGSLPGRARDVSVGGLCVATRSMFAFGSVHRVALQLPQGTLHLAVEGRWQVNSSSEDAFLTGMAFVDPDPSATATLWALIHGAGQALGLFLHQQSDLQTLGSGNAMRIAQISRLKRVPAGRYVYGQDANEPGDDSILILYAGSVTLHFRFGPADEVMLAELGPGSVFGGLPLVAGVPNLESAFARKDSTLVEVSRGAYTHLRLANPILAQRLTQVAARCQIQRVRRLMELASMRR